MYQRKLLFVLLVPTLLMANVIWPALYVMEALLTWWVIVFGLIIEIIMVKKLFDFTLPLSIKTVITANIISAILGIVLIPLSGIVIEIFPGLILWFLLRIGTFNPMTWTLTFVIAAYINAVIEGLVYKKIFQQELLFKSKKFFYLFLINLLSASLSIIVLLQMDKY